MGFVLCKFGCRYVEMCLFVNVKYILLDWNVCYIMLIVLLGEWVVEGNSVWLW